MKRFAGFSAAALAATVFVGTGQAAVSVYDGFTDYTSPLNKQDGGTSFGWNAGKPWNDGAASGGQQDNENSTATIATGNLSAPTDYVYQNGATSGTDLDGQHVSDLPNSQSSGAIRTFADANLIDLGATGTAYFSVLWNESGSGSGGNIRFQFLDDATTSRRIFEFVTASSVMDLLTGNATTDHGGKSFTAGQDYLLVGKIDAQAGAGANDTISFSLWQNGATIGSEPVTWDVAGLVEAGDTDRIINRLFVNGSGNIDMFDEFRLGDTFQDVTGVPEPGSLALLGIGGLLVLGRRRAS